MSAADRLAPLFRLCALACGDPELMQIGASFARWLEGGPGTIEDALHIPDLALLRIAAALESRDRALCDMARRFGFGAPQVAQHVLEYERTGWPADAAATTCPAHLVDSPGEYAWRALRARPHAPCVRHIREILKNGNRDP